LAYAIEARPMLLSTILCVFCLATPAPPAPDFAHAEGDIWVRHEVLPNGAHLLRLSTTDFIIDTHHWRSERLSAFAENYAAQTCQGRYTLLRGARLTSYAGQVVFRCR
jgi:hypothetical protein